MTRPSTNRSLWAGTSRPVTGDGAWEASLPDGANPRPDERGWGGKLALQEARDDQDAEFERQALQGILHQAEQLIAIQGELDLAAGGHDGDGGLGWLGLVGILSLRIGSFQGGSSFLIQGEATSSLATGREEPSSSLFN